MPVVRRYEEEAYQARVLPLVERHRMTRRPSPEVSLSLCVFAWPYDKLWFMDNSFHWVREIDTEFRFRNGIGDFREFAGWHTMEFFEMKNVFRDRYYVSVPTW